MRGELRGRAQRRALLGEDDATMVFETSKGVDVVSTFDQMGLREDLLRGIYAYGESRLSFQSRCEALLQP